ncbi:hypothetical protein [Streptomyces sp. NPDC048650]|uniref:hypothetical protein n=1 Tax=Streptomyces sp. NPDC048650 TaxID=3365583 RepID=UPI003722687D
MPAKSSTIVTALTVVALAVVGVLGYQAAASAPDHLSARGGGHHAEQHPAHHSKPPKEPAPPRPTEVPAASGTGKRVVYSLGAKQVWLVGADGRAQRTYHVTPSTVSPATGAYQVPPNGRSVSVTGSDGIAIEHVVRFTSAQGVVIGFSAAVDGAAPKPGPATKKTGGIRETRDDGKAMWDFAMVGTKVVVVA